MLHRGESVISNCINNIQNEEKQMLMYVASRHLDILQDNVEQLNKITNGRSDIQIKYLNDKMMECKQVINDNIEIILSIKSDLIDN